MNRFLTRSIILGICFSILGVTSCEETSGDPSGKPKGPSLDDDGGSNLVTPPEAWKEKWLDHTKDLERVYFNEDVAVYFDAEMPRTATWTYAFMTDVWKYVKTVYGDFGEEGRLYVVCHTADGRIGRTGNIFDEATSHRSLSDVTGSAEDWTTMSEWAKDAHVHEVGHVVEGSSHGVHESPAFDVWGDSKWAEIFQYDVYKGIGRIEDADRLYDQYMDTKADYPVPDTYWFRDWFYPIYDQYEQAATLNKFFELLSLYFPKSGQSYARRMNMGEFVHFWSGAAEDDLQGLAEDAFGWTEEWQDQLDQAKLDYPNIVY
jgi:hypothetical protein